MENYWCTTVSTMRTGDRPEMADPVRIDTENMVPGIRMFVTGRDIVITASWNWMGERLRIT